MRDDTTREHKRASALQSKSLRGSGSGVKPNCGKPPRQQIFPPAVADSMFDLDSPLDALKSWSSMNQRPLSEAVVGVLDASKRRVNPRTSSVQHVAKVQKSQRSHRYPTRGRAARVATKTSKPRSFLPSPPRTARVEQRGCVSTRGIDRRTFATSVPLYRSSYPSSPGFPTLFGHSTLGCRVGQSLPRRLCRRQHRDGFHRLAKTPYRLDSF